MQRFRLSQVLIAVVLGATVVVLGQNCGQGYSSSSSKTVAPSSSLDGATLYGQYCAACHGALAVSGKAGRSATQITNAINNVPQMSSLKGVLSSAQISAIAKALGGASTKDGEFEGDEAAAAESM